MREYVTEAIVLHKEPVRDLDARYSFFTKKFGKVVGKATSSRKITSKLAGHLEPGTVATVRFVERSGSNGAGASGGISNGTQIVDALKHDKLAASPVDLRLLAAILAEGEWDEALWEELVRGAAHARVHEGGGAAPGFSWVAVLALLGWNPRHAACERCGKKVAAFSIARQQFFCAGCALKIAPDELILLGNAQI